MVAKSVPGANVFWSGAVSAKTASEVSCQKSKVKFWIVGVYPARLSWSAMYLMVISLPGSPAARLPPLASAIFCRFSWWWRTFFSVTSPASFEGAGPAAWAGTAARVEAASDSPARVASAALRMTKSPFVGGRSNPKPDMSQFAQQDTT